MRCRPDLSEADERQAGAFPRGFFARDDEADDARFYAPPRLVTHLDDGAIAAVRALYAKLDVPAGDVLDLMSSWVSHLPERPRSLTVLGMNAAELDANPMADARVVHDLNVEPRLPFDDDAFDAVTCAVSIDYLTRPVAVLVEVGRVLRTRGLLVMTFSNRCFPTKAVRGWLVADDAQRVALVRRMVELSGRFGDVRAETRRSAAAGDPLHAVWARRAESPVIDGLTRRRRP